MKGILTFQLPEEREEFETAVHALDYRCAIDEIWQRVFRPYYKHGYPNADLQALTETDVGEQIIDHLAKLYQEVVAELPTLG